MPDDDARTAPRLPRGAPAELQRFLDCEIDAVDVDVSELDWIPLPRGTELAGVTLEPGREPNQATMRIGVGMLSVSIGVSIIDGRLDLDTASIPRIEGVTDELVRAIERWERRINDGFAEDKQLATLTVRGKIASLTKRTVPAPAAAVAPVPVAPAGPSTADEPSTAPGSTSNWKKVLGIGAGLVLGAGGLIGGCLALTGGDDEAERTEPPPADEATDEPEVGVADPEPADDDPAGDTEDTADGAEPDEQTADEPEVAEFVPTRGGEAVVGLGEQPFATLNPFLPGGEGARSTLDPVFAGVADVDPATGELIPDVVVELPTVANSGVSLNDDGSMTVRYRIRDEAVWADGTPISADDFLFTYETIMNPDLPMDRGVYEDIATTETGPGTFAFTMPTPTIDHQLLFDTLIPRHAVEGTDFFADWNDTMWVSGGPFVFDQWQRDEFIRLVRNDDYWELDPDTGTQLPFLDSVTLRFTPATEVLLDAFASREVDVIDPPPSIETFEALQALEPEGAVVEVLSGPIWEHLNFQFGDSRRAANPDSMNEHLSYRRAVAHAIDKVKIVDEILAGQVEPLDSYVDAFAPSLSSGAWAQYDYDPTAAMALLDELCGELRRDCGANPIRTVVTAQDPRVAQLIIDDLSAVGIVATTPGSSSPDLLPDSGPFEISLREVDDPWGHLQFIGTMPDGAQIRLFRDGTVEIDAPAPFIPVSGEIGSDGSFVADGVGTAAGFPGVDATATGSLVDGVLDLEYTLGGPLPNGPITYFFDGGLVPPAGPALTPEEAQTFADDLSVWIQFGGERYGQFTFDALDPIVLQAYGPETCRAFFGELPADPTFDIEVNGVGPPGLFRYHRPGPGTVVPGAFPVDVSVTSNDTTSRQTLHLRRAADGSLRWFSVCPREPNTTLSQLFTDLFDTAGLPYEDQLEDSALFFGETLDFGNWDLGEWAWVGTPGLSGVVGIHDVFDPEAPPPDGSNFYRWGTPAVTGSDPAGFDQGPSSVIDESTARYSEIAGEMRTTVDEDELAALIAEAEQILADQAVIIPLYARLVSSAVWSDEIGGEFGRSGPGSMWNMEEWYRTDR